MSTSLSQGKDLVALRRMRVAEAIRAIEMGLLDHNAPDFFHALVRNLALHLRVQHALVSEFLGEKKWRVRTLGLWISNHFGMNYEYSLYDTPCAKVLKGTACFFPNSIQASFPRDKDLKQLHAESYLGVPATNAKGEVVGHLVIMDTKPMQDKPFLLAILRYFADQVAEELENRDKET